MGRLRPREAGQPPAQGERRPCRAAGGQGQVGQGEGQKLKALRAQHGVRREDPAELERHRKKVLPAFSPQSEPMKKFTQYFLSPNAWIGLFSIMAVAGLLSCIIGFVAHIRPLVEIGLCLTAPLLMGGIVIIVVIIPLLIVANWKRRQ